MKLAFVLSHACPLKCNFCCSTRDVVGPGRIRRETIQETLIGFAAEPAFLDFGFTGGDPFLYLADIKAAVAGARQAGVTQPFQMTTSAYWAKDEAGVHSILSELAALGLNQLMLSYDSEHAKWVSAAQITTVCDAAERLGIGIHISATFWDLSQDLRDLLPEIVDRPNVKVLHHSVAPMGRARETAVWPRRYDLPVESKLSCGRPGEYLFSIYPDGEVYPCCSGGFQIEGRLSCGNIHRDTPAKIIYAGLTNFHVRLAKEFGWAVLYAVVEREAPELVSELPRFEDVDSVCEICRDLNLDLGERLAPVRDVIEREYARARAEREWRRLDASGAARSIDGRLLSLAGFLALIETDRAIRLDYLAGVLQLQASQDSATRLPLST
jgi:MoaA/NifB/PqqE/SkfB family radical SAM enzyme